MRVLTAVLLNADFSNLSLVRYNLLGFFALIRITIKKLLCFMIFFNNRPLFSLRRVLDKTNLCEDLDVDKWVSFNIVKIYYNHS